MRKARKKLRRETVLADVQHVVLLIISNFSLQRPTLVQGPENKGLENGNIPGPSESHCFPESSRLMKERRKGRLEETEAADNY